RLSRGKNSLQRSVNEGSRRGCFGPSRCGGPNSELRREGACRMDLRQIIYFLSIYDAGNLTKASQKEHVAQPALSVQLRRLEDELGVSLFERHSQGVIPTVAGKRFYELCQSIVSDVSRARSEMLAFATELSGRMTVGLPSALNRSVLGLF